MLAGKGPRKLDVQPSEHGSYHVYAADLFFDSERVTAQLDVVRRSGAGFVAVPAQTVLMWELGYHFAAIHSSPILRYERRQAREPRESETDAAVGFAYWALGHVSNLKAFYTRLVPGAARSSGQFNLQWQVFGY